MIFLQGLQKGLACGKKRVLRASAPKTAAKAAFGRLLRVEAKRLEGSHPSLSRP